MTDQRDGGIAWTDTTWNCVRGCSRVNASCINCYAERMAMRFSGPGLPYHGLVRLSRKESKSGAPIGWPGESGKPIGWSGDVRMVPERLADPLRWKRPRKVFVNSMSDLFHEKLTNEQIAAVFGVMAAAPRHQFQVLTKRPERMREWFAWAARRGEDGRSIFPDDDPSWRTGQMLAVELRRLAGIDGGRRGTRATRWEDFDPRRQPWPLPNVWLGVSVGNQDEADEMIPPLLETPAAIRWASYEPAHGPVDFHAFLRGKLRDECLSILRHGDTTPTPGLDWIVCGAESGPRARPFDLNWARSVVAQGRDGGVKVFVKQLGKRPFDRVEAFGPLASAGYDPDDLLKIRPRPPQMDGWTRVSTEKETAFYRYMKLRHAAGADPSEWPESLRVQEFPT